MVGGVRLWCISDTGRKGVSESTKTSSRRQAPDESFAGDGTSFLLGMQDSEKTGTYQLNDIVVGEENLKTDRGKAGGDLG